MYSSTLSLTSALDCSGWSTPQSGYFTLGMTQYQGQSGAVQKIFPWLGFAHCTCLFYTLVTSLGRNTAFFLTGYVLATLPSEAVKRATNSQCILEAIGKLSLPELLVATKEIKPYNYAQLLLEKHASINFCIHYI